MEVMDILFGDNDDTSAEEFEPENKEEIPHVNAYKETAHPYFSKFVEWGRKHGILDNVAAINVPYKFYLVDCDTCAFTGNSVKTEEPGVPELPTYRLYGVDEEDRSVCCFVQGFKPYFFANPTNAFVEDDLSVFQTSLNLAINHEIERHPRLQYLTRYTRITEPVVSVEIVANPEDENILGYHPSKLRQEADFECMLKVNCSLTAFIRIAAEVLRKGKVTCPFLDEPCTYNVYETNINPVVRFLTSHNLSCCSWVEISGNIHRDDHSHSYAQVEFTVNHGQISTENDGPSTNENIPRLRILSFDIECMVRPPEYIMPRDGCEQVIQISNVLRCYGDDDNTPVQVVFTLGLCDPLPDAEVLSFNDEESLLESWRLFVVLTDPDIVTGYNINRFDIPFLLDRARRLGVKTFPYLGRHIELPASYRKINGRGSSKYSDPWADVVPYIRGRVVFDMLPVMRQMFPEEASFKLAYISRRFLGCTKGDVHYSEIFELQTMSTASRKRLADYCLQDSWLVAELLLRKPIGDESSKASFIQHYCEKAKSSGSPLRYVVSKSNKYNTYFRTVRKHKNPNLVFQPVTPVSRKRIASIAVPRMDKVRRRLFKEDSGENPGKSSQSEDALEELSYENKQS